MEKSLASQGPASRHKDRVRVLPPHKGHHLPAPGSLVMAWATGAQFHPRQSPRLGRQGWGQPLHSCLRSCRSGTGKLVEKLGRMLTASKKLVPATATLE